jgi:hypothetical protein
MTAVSVKPAKPGKRNFGGVGLVLVSFAALLLGGCDKTWVLTYDGAAGARADDALVDIVLTSDRGDAYVFEGSGRDLRVTAAPTNAAANMRALFWPAAAPSVTDSQSCATWTGQTEEGSVQQGAALRVRTDDAGKTRAITVTKNIFFGFDSIFNVHVWDTSKDPPSMGVKQLDMIKPLREKPFPWHLCARVTGSVLSIRVWAGNEPEPEWGDGVHDASAALPPGWVYEGRAGWYIGHLPPGGFAGFADLETWKYEIDGVGVAAPK